MSFPQRIETDRIVLRLYDAHDLEAHVGILEKLGFIHEGDVPEKYDREGHCEGCSEFYRLKIGNWKNQ